MGISKLTKKLLQRLDVFIGWQSSIDALQEKHGLLEKQLDQLRNEVMQHQTFVRWSVLDDMRNFHEYKVSIVKCPLCEHESDKVNFNTLHSYCIFQGGNLLRFQCPECDLIFGDQKMLSLTNEALSHDYEWHYKSYFEGDSTEQEIRAFHLLNPEKEGVYLNYGAGAWSSSVSELRNEGWDVWAYEPHDSANNSDEHYVVRSKEMLAKMKFDGIFSNNVLEHLRYPIDDLRLMAGLLKLNASMAHATPCFEYLYEYTRFHLFFYPGRSRELLAEKADLKVANYVRDDEFMCAILQGK